MDKKLYLEFEDESGEIAKIVIDGPKDDLNEEIVVEQMTAILQANVFDSKGNDLAAASKAYVIEQVRSDYL